MILSRRFREWDAGIHPMYIPGKQKRARGRELHPEKGVKGSHTSSQPLVRTTTSSEHNGQRRCLSAFRQTKWNCRTKRKQVLWWSEKERERERKCLFRELSCVRGKGRGLLRETRVLIRETSRFASLAVTSLHKVHKRPRATRRRGSSRDVPW